MKLLKWLSLGLLTGTLIACDTGYQWEEGQWTWVQRDEAAGKSVRVMESVDAATFQIMDPPTYAKDKNHVYLEGRIIPEAHAGSFRLLEASGYARDQKHIFLQQAPVIFADPASFEVLAYPYSRDQNHVFCGTLPLPLSPEEVPQFNVTNQNKRLAGATSISTLSGLLLFYPEYQWLDTLEIDRFVIGTGGTGETNHRKFQGPREITE